MARCAAAALHRTPASLLADLLGSLVPQITHFYETVATRTPVLLENDDMTYEFLRFERGDESKTASTEASYAVPSDYQADGSCERVARDVGFPYIHLLHTFVRF